MQGSQTRLIPSSGRASSGELLERERDLATVAQALAGAAAGRSGVVVIEGPAGIGKTRLLTEGRRLAQEAGVGALHARASDLEGELAFGVVHQLFEQAVRARSLDLAESALAATGEVLCGSPLAPRDAGSSDASFATLQALHRFTVALSADSPLALLVDDLHWCDEPSLRFLNYLVRRLEGLAVAVLCTVRPRERRARASLVVEVLGDPLTTVVSPSPLSRAAASRLIMEGLGESADATFSAACHTATGGNPLLLRELISTMQIEGVQPDNEHVRAVTDVGPRAVSRAVLVRLSRLSDDALRLARVASVVHTGADLAFLGQLAALAADEAATAAGALVAAEVFSNDTAGRFVHPLVGAAVYEDMTVPDRSLIHQRAAVLHHERGDPAGTVAVHLALAPAGGQAWVGQVLEDAARESLRAGSPAVAVRYLTRAFAEPPAAERRARLLLELGRAEAMLHTPSAIEHLTEAFEQDTDTEVREQAAVSLARTLLFSDRADEAVALIRRTNTEMAPGCDLRLGLEALELMAPAFGAGTPLSPKRLQRALTPGPGPGAKMLAAVVSRQLAYAGGNIDQCSRLAIEALDGGVLMAADDAFLPVTAILTLVRADRPEATEHWEDLAQQSALRGSLAGRAGSSLWRGYAYLRRGDLDNAEQSLENAVEEFRLLGFADEPRAHHAAFLAAVLRERGRLDDARRVLHGVKAPRGSSDAARYWLDSLAQQLLAEERVNEAQEVAADLERRFAFLANLIDTPARSHRAVAVYHLGRRDEGLELATESLELAYRWGAPGGISRALRVLGELEREDGLGHLQDAVDVAEGSVARLEHAKALVALGTSLRRARRPTDAREPLRRGLELALTLGATALSNQAQHELRAAGARPRTTALAGPEALTPAERRVAQRAAAGQTNRAIADALFVTTKTVELHLRNAYRKLGVRSRHELAGPLGVPPVDVENTGVRV